MKTFNQDILNGMIDKAIATLAKSRFGDGWKLKNVPVTLNTRMRVVAGICIYYQNNTTIRIEINYQYTLVATEEQVYNTVAHELAHAYQVLLSGNTDHGSTWQAIHTAMGGTAERFHTVPVQRNQVQRHKILDLRDGKVYTLTTRRWNQISFLKLSDGKDRFVKQETFIKPQMAMS